MPHIQQLSSHVADLIAAGEVVERPASVVKELVENAMDAGATAVRVEIRRGRNGSHPGFRRRLRHRACGTAHGLFGATPPLSCARRRTWGSIGTLGFRGEALAAIAAVSRVEILTRPKGAQSGASLHLEGGVPGPVEEAGAPEEGALGVGRASCQQRQDKAQCKKSASSHRLLFRLLLLQPRRVRIRLSECPRAEGTLIFLPAAHGAFFHGRRAQTEIHTLLVASGFKCIIGICNIKPALAGEQQPGRGGIQTVLCIFRTLRPRAQSARLSMPRYVL